MSPPRGVVAAGHDLTARAAAEILREGGNAFDAAIAALGAACVAEPVLASPGGGGFMLTIPAGGKPRLYDFFVHTPKTAHPIAELDFHPVWVDFGTARQEFHIGRGTAAVPGMIRGLFAVHRDLGSIPMRELMGQGVALAKDGVRISDFQAYLFDVVRATFAATSESLAIFGRSPNLQLSTLQTSTLPARASESSGASIGELVKAGDTLRQPQLADTLESIAVEGPDLFYRGEIAERVVQDMANGGQLTRADFSDYEVAVRAPLMRRYRNVELYTNPPPASGGLLVAFTLALLETFELNNYRFGQGGHLCRVAHALAETSEARVAMQAAGRQLDEDVLAPELLAQYRTSVLGRAAARRGTTHLSVIDGLGNVASVTVSNGEGSGYVVPGTGVVMNNMLGEEDLNPNGFQRWQPDTRMTSMMSPSAVRWANGRWLATGSGGSNRIRSAIVQVLSNLIDFELDLESAVNRPRMHFEPHFPNPCTPESTNSQTQSKTTGLLSIEGGFHPEQLHDVLDDYPEHQVWDSQNMFFGGAHTVEAGPGGMVGVGDPRRGGASELVE